MPASTSMPDVVVEVAFATDPGSTAPTWVDVSAYVEAKGDGGPITISRGRSDELTEIQPSQLTITFDNRDGRFTAGNASSPYYPNVTLGRRIRVREIWSAVTYYRFDGYVNEWPTEWPDGSTVKATVTITASSRQAQLGRRQALRSIIEQEVLQESPSLYYLLNEPSDATKANTSLPYDIPAALNQKGSGAAYAFGNATGPSVDGYTALKLNGGQYIGRTFASPVVERGTAGFTMEIPFVAPTPGTGTLMLLASDNNEPPAFYPDRYCQLFVGGGGGTHLGVEFSFGGGTNLITSAGSVTDGSVHHAAVTITDSGANVDAELFLDGVSVGTATLAAATIGSLSYMTLGGGFSSPFTGTLAHAAVYPTTVLSGAAIADHAEAATTGFAGESSDARITRLSEYAGIDPSFLALEAGVALVDNQFTEAADPTTLMQDVARTEGGVVFDAGDGDLVFHNRRHRDNATAALTLSVSSGEVEGGVTFKLDDQGVANEVTATSGDSTARATSTASITAHGVYSTGIAVVTNSDDDLIDAANYHLQRYAEPVVRAPSLPVSVNTLASSQVPLVLAREIGDEITITNLPAQAPSTTMSFFIEGYTEQIGAETYVITFNLSPASLSAVWVLNSASYSQLDSTTVLGL